MDQRLRALQRKAAQGEPTPELEAALLRAEPDSWFMFPYTTQVRKVLPTEQILRDPHPYLREVPYLGAETAWNDLKTARWPNIVLSKSRYQLQVVQGFLAEHPAKDPNPVVEARRQAYLKALEDDSLIGDLVYDEEDVEDILERVTDVVVAHKDVFELAHRAASNVDCDRDCCQDTFNDFYFGLIWELKFRVVTFRAPIVLEYNKERYAWLPENL